MCVSAWVCAHACGACGGQTRVLPPMELSYNLEPPDLVLGTELGIYCKSSRDSEPLSHLSHLAVFEAESYTVTQLESDFQSCCLSLWSAVTIVSSGGGF